MDLRLNSVLPVSESRKLFVEGLVAAIPIVIGYLPIGITFGVLSIQADISLYHAVLMSGLVFAGASQFVGLNMLIAEAASFTIIFTTCVINLRYLVMSMSLMHSVKVLPNGLKALLAFGVTDETFVVASLKNKQSGWFLGGLIFTAYASWVCGTLIGGLLADFIPSSVSSGMAIALYAMFIGLLVPSVRKSWKVGVIAIASALLSYIFSLFLDMGWTIIGATILGSALGIFLFKDD